MAWCSERLLRLLGRKKTLDTASVLTTELRRCLSTLDLTFFGAGIMVGVGVFVLTGTMVRDLAGPAAFLSYMISGFVALLNALCYAELGARLPRAGSAYVYTYVAIGEPWAFFVGWNMILEHTVSTAVVSKGFSGTLNAMTGDVIGNWSLSHLVPLMGTQIQDYPDLVAVAMVIVTMLFVLYGVRESVSVNNLISVLLLFVLVLLIVVGFLHADLDNWVGVVGGFLPFGWRGIMRGAATCFYAFVGFESIAVAGEETRDPSRSIPIALSLSLLLVTTLYVLCSATLGLMVPYYLVDLVAPYPDAFARSGVVWAKYVVGIGSLFAYATSLLGALYMTCRTLYAMANDGLLFAILSRVYPRTQTPVVSILATVAMAVPLALLLDLEILVECVSIGTLMSLVTVSMSVLVLRYRPAAKCTFDCRLQQPNEKVSADDQGRLTDASDLDNSGKLKVWLQSSWLNNWLPVRLSESQIISLLIPTVLSVSLVVHGSPLLTARCWWAIMLLSIAIVWLLGCFVVLLFYEQNTKFPTFKVPLVPLTPTVTLYINIVLLLQLSWMSWVRVAVWLLLGATIYIFYGISHSKENLPLVSTEANPRDYNGAANTRRSPFDVD